MNKKAVSDIIVTIFIILLVLVTVVIVWQVVKKTVQQGTGKMDVDIMSVQLTIKQNSVAINYTSNTAFLAVSRGADNFNLSAIKLVVRGKEKSLEWTYYNGGVIGIPEPLGTKVYGLNITGLKNITRISAYPVSQSGKIGIEARYDVKEEDTRRSPPSNPPMIYNPGPEPGPCMRNCDGKDCGGDGCGGSCGTCPSGKVCDAGVCAECTSGTVEDCNTGQSGVCALGSRTCSISGAWGDCERQVTPVAENCNNDLDDDCDGAADCSDTNCVDNTNCFVQTNFQADYYIDNSVGNDAIAALSGGANFVFSSNICKSTATGDGFIICDTATPPFRIYFKSGDYNGQILSISDPSTIIDGRSFVRLSGFTKTCAANPCSISPTWQFNILVPEGYHYSAD